MNESLQTHAPSPVTTSVPEEVEIIDPDTIEVTARVHVQIDIMYRMLPEDLRGVVLRRDLRGPIPTREEEILYSPFDDLFYKWTEKYGERFRNYCYENRKDQDFIKRVASEKISEEDFIKLKPYLEMETTEGKEGSIFLKTEEISDLRLKLLH